MTSVVTGAAKPVPHHADAAFGQSYIEQGFDHAGQIHPAPAHHAVVDNIHRPALERAGSASQGSSVSA
jgi:hypothetical protein